MPFILPPATAAFSNDIASDGYPECLDLSQHPSQPIGENLTPGHGWHAVLNGGNSITVNTQTTVALTSDRTFNSYVNSPTSFLTVNRLFINVNGVIKSLLASSVDGTTVYFTFPSNFFTSTGTYDIRVYDTTGNQNNLFCYVTGSVTISPPPYTPIYLGNATVTNTGDFNLAGTIMNSTRFPQDQHELVPRAYVDSYIASVVSYYNRILDPNNSVDASGNKITVIDRVAYLEAQLERVYKALWDVDRNVAAIVTPHSGSLTADYVAALSDDATLIANPPAAPGSLSGFQ